MVRVGMGYDVHKLTEGRDLILGGVKIPWELGLLGHSDADVVVHAIMDALLGAAALRDIGRHFPDTDPQYKGISSILLLQKVGALLKEKGYQIVNIDATIIAQRPKLAAYRWQMHWNFPKIRSISKQRQKRDLDLPVHCRAFHPRQSAAYKRHRIDKKAGIL